MSQKSISHFGLGVLIGLLALSASANQDNLDTRVKSLETQTQDQEKRISELEAVALANTQSEFRCYSDCVFTTYTHALGSEVHVLTRLNVTGDSFIEMLDEMKIECSELSEDFEVPENSDPKGYALRSPRDRYISFSRAEDCEKVPQ